MAIRRPPSTFSDELTASDLAANSVGASELADNAVDTAAIADDAVTNAKMGANAITSTEIAANAVGESELSVDYTAQSVPHIIPGVLYPAYDDKKLDGTALAASTTGPASSTVASSKYGTVQSDGRMYYYTFIKGSKPIKDPRIGAYFGSQRHQLDSLQLLEQETATHGSNVYSVDGREWIRAVGGITTTNDLNGVRILLNSTTDFVEIVGYFSDFNYGVYTDGANRTIRYTLDADDEEATNYGATTASTPLGSRYVDTSSSINLGLGATLGIHTIKLKRTGTSINNLYNIELIAQDTQDFTATNASNILTTTGHTLTNGDQIRLAGSDLPNGLNATTTYYVVGVSGNNFQVATSSGGSAVTFSDDGSGTRTWRSLNNIQIPSQNVVSYGKKFAISATADHYDPFTTMTYGGSGTTASALGSLIDTDTSLGMDAWKAGTANYHRPWNGGRVVKWVDSSGTIKTSVTMMPPNAQNAKGTASDAVSDAHVIAGTNDNIINFNTTTIANAADLSEITKSFHWREFGNGATNEGAGGSHIDASMLNTGDDFAYVMDDGLTSLSGDDCNRSLHENNDRLLPAADGDSWSFTFIGTGLQFFTDNASWAGTPVVQNLPYGTHVLTMKRDADEAGDVFIDGHGLTDVTYTNYGCLVNYLNIYQPKRPPIPEDACVIADYMLMADFVTMTSAGVEYIPKGVRFVAQSRDYKFDKTGGTFGPATGCFSSHDPQRRTGQYFWYKGAGTYTQELPFFGDSFVCHYSTENDSDYANPVFTLNGSALSGFTNTGNGTGFTSVTAAGVVTETGNSAADNVVNFKAPAGTLGSNTLKVSVTSSSTSHYLYNRHFSVVTPIHTSSHYQSFETPFLHELVGGDRNMEQTNLVCSPDGKTWDEITRDTSYIGNIKLHTRTDTDSTWATYVILDEWRGGAFAPISSNFNKDFAIAYDRIICLKDGQYNIAYHFGATADLDQALYINTTNVLANGGNHTTNSSYESSVNVFMVRGDYIRLRGEFGHNPNSMGDLHQNYFSITKI